MPSLASLVGAGAGAAGLQALSERFSEFLSLSWFLELWFSSYLDFGCCNNVIYVIHTEIVYSYNNYVIKFILCDENDKLYHYIDNIIIMDS